MVTTDSQEAVPPFHEYETLVIRRYSVVVVKPEGTLYVADVAPAIVDQLGDVRLVFSCQIYANVELGIVVVPAVVVTDAVVVFAVIAVVVVASAVRRSSRQPTEVHQ